MSHFKTGIYLRGPVYEELLPHGFERSKRGYDEPDSLVQMRPRGDSVAYEVFTQPLGGLELLSLGRVRHARIVSGGDSNPSVPLRMRGLAATGTLTASRRVVGPLRYVVEGTIETPSRVPVLGGVGGEPDDVTDVNLVSLTELPEHVDARIIALAADLTQEAGTFREKARTIRKHLADGFEYSLEQPNADKPDPLASFLFDDRRGHCEYFATAFATLLRAAGVPSRVIGGYQGGIWDEDTNVLLFSGKSAHSWVEWYQPGTGWIIDDATPALYTQRQYLTGLAKMYERVQRMWDEYIVEYGQAHQLAFVARTYAAMSRPGWTTARSIRAYYVFGIVVLALLVFWYRRRNRAQPIRIRRLESLADAMAAVLERTRGREIPEHMPLRVAFEEAVSTQALSAEPLGTLRGALTYYETTRFGNRSIDTETVRFWLARLRRIKRRV